MPGSGPTWSTRFTFVLAAIGASVGLGNIWKFPYVAGTNGGAAFVGVYLGCVAAIAIPILIAELMLGRHGRGSPPTAMARAAASSARAPLWRMVGWLGAWSGFLIVSFYSVIAGWALAYVLRAASGALSGVGGQQAAALFEDLLASPFALALWHTVFMVTTTVVVGRGLNRGIEAAVRFLMPALFIMLVILTLYAMAAGSPGAAWAFLFRFESTAVDGAVVLMAIGQAFFSIGVSMGLMMMYGAYLPAGVSIPGHAVVIALADTAVALLAGLAIFPLVFAHGLDPAEGPGLIFVSLPIAFGNMPLGAMFGALFFLLLVFAALTSAIALIQPMVARVQEHPAITPGIGAALTGTVAWLLGLASVLSFNVWSEVTPLGWLPAFAGSTIYDLLDYFTANVMMPLGGLLIALFAGWFASRRMLTGELSGMPPVLLGAWRFAVRVVAPAGIALVFVTNLI
ncbi:MAG: sodium-dependent transporter [Pseudomonadota bacterium]